MTKPSKWLAFLAALSLAISLALIAARIRGFHGAVPPTKQPTASVTSAQLLVHLTRNFLELYILTPSPDHPKTHCDWHGFGYIHAELDIGTAHGSLRAGIASGIHLPTWFAILATLALPAWLCVRILRYRARPRAGHCPTCGYDLRATPDRCPECGLLTAGLPTAGAPTAGAANPRAV